MFINRVNVLVPDFEPKEAYSYFLSKIAKLDFRSGLRKTWWTRFGDRINPSGRKTRSFRSSWTSPECPGKRRWPPSESRWPRRRPTSSSSRPWTKFAGKLNRSKKDVQLSSINQAGLRRAVSYNLFSQSVLLPGCSTSAAPTSSTTRCSSPIAQWPPTESSSSSTRVR